MTPAKIVPTKSHLGVVVVGRNEGERLGRCLASVTGRGLPVIYVDGNSTDGSAALARGLGADVIEEDPSRRNCTATARNAGFDRLCELDPELRFVQFLDGDCEVVDGWIEQGQAVLQERPDLALVSGRRRERFPERSIYNRLADIDWDFPIGEIDCAHGDAMVRADAFRTVGGFNPAVKVGEDRELCLRLRRGGWVLLRVDAEMTVHDIAITRFAEWWRRCVRTGYGFAQGALLHGGPPERHCVRHVCSSLFWGLALPLLVLGLAWPTRGASLLLAAAYPIQAVRIARRSLRAGMPPRDAWPFGWYCMLSRIPNAIGLIGFWIERIPGLSSDRRVITYK